MSLQPAYHTQLVVEVRKGKVMDKVVDLGINVRSLYVKDVDRKVAKLTYIARSILFNVLHSIGDTCTASAPSDLLLRGGSSLR